MLPESMGTGSRRISAVARCDWVSKGRPRPAFFRTNEKRCRCLVSEATVLAVLIASVLLGTACGGSESPSPVPPAEEAAEGERPAALECPPGEWTSSEDARWLTEVVARAGFTISSCTGSAFVVSAGEDEFFLWAFSSALSAEQAAEPGMQAVSRAAGVPVYLGMFEGNAHRGRGVWQAGRRLVWFESGPSADQGLPSLQTVEMIVRASL